MLRMHFKPLFNSATSSSEKSMFVYLIILGKKENFTSGFVIWIFLNSSNSYAVSYIS
jgi:hypothetical protein